MIEKFQTLEVRGRKSSKPWKFFAVLFPMLGSLAFAQGPGSQVGFFQAWWGKSSLWTPLDMPNLIAWWDVSDAESISLVAGTNRVSEWRDKSGNNYHATQTNATRRPFYRDDVVSGQKVIDMSDSLAARTFLSISTNIGGTNKFYYIVYRKVTTGNSIIFISGSSNYDYLQYGNNWFVGDLGQTISINTNDFTMRGAYTAFSGANIVRYSNAVAQATQSGANTALGMSSIGNSINSQVSDIAIREIVYVNQNPATSDRQKLEGYLAWNNDMVDKLPANHPYKNSPPTR